MSKQFTKGPPAPSQVGGMFSPLLFFPLCLFCLCPCILYCSLFLQGVKDLMHPSVLASGHHPQFFSPYILSSFARGLPLCLCSCLTPTAAPPPSPLPISTENFSRKTGRVPQTSSPPLLRERARVPRDMSLSPCMCSVGFSSEPRSPPFCPQKMVRVAPLCLEGWGSPLCDLRSPRSQG